VQTEPRSFIIVSKVIEETFSEARGEYTDAFEVYQPETTRM
jgi:hypothetical protein